MHQITTMLAMATAAAAAPPAHAAAVSPHSGEIFSCTTDRSAVIRHKHGDPQNTTVMSDRRVRHSVKLWADAASRPPAFVLKVLGRDGRSYSLSDVHQGSSGGSGAGGRADTEIHGTSGATTVKIFVSYENNGLHGDVDAKIEINGREDVLLTCAGGRYKDDLITMQNGRSTNIFTLARDGLAKPLADPPGAPDTPMNHNAD